MGAKLFDSPTPSGEIFLFPLFWNRKENLGRPSFNPNTCSEETEIPITN